MIFFFFWCPQNNISCFSSHFLCEKACLLLNIYLVKVKTNFLNHYLAVLHTKENVYVCCFLIKLFSSVPSLFIFCIFVLFGWIQNEMLGRIFKVLFSNAVKVHDDCQVWIKKHDNSSPYSFCYILSLLKSYDSLVWEQTDLNSVINHWCDLPFNQSSQILFRPVLN